MGSRETTRGHEGAPERRLGFLQLCADKRFHRMTMTEFERVTKLRPDEYWIEATAGGAPAFGAATLTASYAHAHGAKVMGWAAHGDDCGGFPGRTNDEMKAKLRSVAEDRSKDFPDADHWVLFAAGGKVETSLLV